jgi:phenylpyruvate tautomerase PptA (4-oxalocrotonate tautomerase family)
MPLWKVYHPEGAYSLQDKHAFSKRITEIYFEVPLPKFYVVVVFREVPQDFFYVGGEPVAKFVRIHMDHIARQMTSEAQKTKFFKRVESAIAPFIKDAGSIGNFT